jgi:5-methylcytosine-specific restriction endonuclease McrA
MIVEPSRCSNPKRQVKRARLRSFGDLTPATWKRILKAHDGVCVYCGERAELELDHVVPIARGGRSDVDNVAPCCMRCNQDKGGLLLSEWLSRDAFIELLERVADACAKDTRSER